MHTAPAPAGAVARPVTVGPTDLRVSGQAVRVPRLAVVLPGTIAAVVVAGTAIGLDTVEVTTTTLVMTTAVTTHHLRQRALRPPRGHRTPPP